MYSVECKTKMLGNWSRLILGCTLMALLAACGSANKDNVFPDRRMDYKRQKQTVEPLEIPPDLTSSTIDEALVVPDITPADSATYSEYAGERQGKPVVRSSEVLPNLEDIRVERDGDKRWLVIHASVDEVWAKARAFWVENGFLLTVENPNVGVMETNWAENRADIKQDFVTDAVRKFLDRLYTAATRDRYRVRLERGTTPGTTELYLTHRGMEEVVRQQGIDTATTTVWQARPSDHELEAEMLRRMMVFFGVEDQKARRVLARKDKDQPRAQLSKDGRGNAMLRIDDGFAQAWRLVGVALDRVGFSVEDRDRSRGLYYVRYNDPNKDDESESGLFSKLAFWKGSKQEGEVQYLVNVQGSGDTTRVTVLNKDGEPERSGTGTRILTLIEEQIK